ncbi:hypothetical protein ACLOJK_012888 [Asimina triloba]
MEDERSRLKKLGPDSTISLWNASTAICIGWVLEYNLDGAGRHGSVDFRDSSELLISAKSHFCPRVSRKVIENSLTVDSVRGTFVLLALMMIRCSSSKSNPLLSDLTKNRRRSLLAFKRLFEFDTLSSPILHTRARYERPPSIKNWVAHILDRSDLRRLLALLIMTHRVVGL